jgi:hypothetical protein
VAPPPSAVFRPWNLARSPRLSARGPQQTRFWFVGVVDSAVNFQSFRSRAMTCDVGDDGDSDPLPHPSTRILKGLTAVIPRASQLGVRFSRPWLFRSRAMSAMTRDHGDPYPTPSRLFCIFVANKGTYPNRPLGDPCVTLGWPLGHAWATQGPPKPNPKQAEGRGFWVCFFSQELRAKSQEPS